MNEKMAEGDYTSTSETAQKVTRGGKRNGVQNGYPTTKGSSKSEHHMQRGNGDIKPDLNICPRDKQKVKNPLKIAIQQKTWSEQFQNKHLALTPAVQLTTADSNINNKSAVSKTKNKHNRSSASSEVQTNRSRPVSMNGSSPSTSSLMSIDSSGSVISCVNDAMMKFTSSTSSVNETDCKMQSGNSVRSTGVPQNSSSFASSKPKRRPKECFCISKDFFNDQKTFKSLPWTI